MMSWEDFCQTVLPAINKERWKYHDFTSLRNTKFRFDHAVFYDEKKIAAEIAAYRLHATDTILLVFVDGCFMPALSQLDKMPEEAIICPLQAALQQHAKLFAAYPTLTPTLDMVDYPFANFNITKTPHGLFLFLPENYQLKLPVHLLFISQGENFIAHTQNHFILSAQSKLELIEEHIALSQHTYLLNSFTQMHIEREAELVHTKIQNENCAAFHFAYTAVSQSDYSRTAFMQISKGSLLARDELTINLKGSHATCRLLGFSRLQHDAQCIDHHIEVNHLAPLTQSEMLYKSVLDKSSRSIFNGRVYVDEEAQKIKAYQANHNLLLSAVAEVYSKPELEIYAQDVQCKHGATTGQLDRQALFYLRSRGISEAHAQEILLQGFADEIIKDITQPAVQLRAQQMVIA